MPGWKTAQSKREIVKKTKLALFILAIVFGLIFLSQAVKFTKLIFSPWNFSNASKRSYIWNGDFNINILFRTRSISLVSYNPHAKKITIINIPNNSFLEVSHGYGKWQLSSIYGLGGELLLKDSLTSFFAIPIDGFLSFSGKFFQKEPSEIVNELKKNPISLLSVLSSVRTDLTPFELFRLQVGLSQVRFDKKIGIDLEKIGLLEKFKLADGTFVYTADSQNIDSLSSYIIDPNFQSEHKTIAVFNSTDHPNLAQKAGRLIANIGGDVIIVSNSQNRLKGTQIIGEKSKTMDRLKQIFIKSDKIDPKIGDLGSSRAQINIFLGEDYFDGL